MPLLVTFLSISLAFSFDNNESSLTLLAILQFTRDKHLLHYDLGPEILNLIILNLHPPLGTIYCICVRFIRCNWIVIF